ncbi:MAG: 30S ribosomal protein S2 [SAR324 cluster bacterium]|nr:30S ribosomal protein S2 [SAR324 cluster bacterium]
MAVISMKQFLEAGVHFGHQTKRWHPKMSPYIYGIKNGIHVIDLRQTLTKLKEAYEYVKASAEEGRVPLFVGTKTQIQRIVKEEADRCGCPYINFRWLGGLLTNFGTVKQSIARMKSFEEIAGEDGNYEGIIKKEALLMERKRLKLARSLGGVRNMKSIPSILFITDCHKEQLALKEAQKLGISVVGVSDTNCDPTGIDFMIPGNDDSPRAVALYAGVISNAVMEGLALRKHNRIDPSPAEKVPSKKAKTATIDSAGKKEFSKEGKAVPITVKTEKKDSEKVESPTEIKAKPVPGKEKPVPGKGKPVPGKEKPVSGKEKPVPGKEKPAEVKAAVKKTPTIKNKTKVKIADKKVNTASEKKAVEKKPTATKTNKKSETEK